MASSIWRFLINLDKFCKDNTEDDIIIEVQRAAHHLLGVTKRDH
jgi:hypothetical protein